VPDTVLVSHAFLSMDSFTRSARSPYWPLVEIAGSLYYSPIKKAVNALERGQTRQMSVIGVERRKIVSSSLQREIYTQIIILIREIRNMKLFWTANTAKCLIL